MSTENTPVVQNTPASETDAYVVQEAAGGAPPEPGAQQEAFDKALAMLEGDGADSGGDGSGVGSGIGSGVDGGIDATPAAKPEPPKPDAQAGSTEDADPFKQRFEQYRREYARLDDERKQLKTQIGEFDKLKADLAEARYNPNKLLELGNVSQEEFTKLLLESGGEITPTMRVALEAKQRADSSEKQLAKMRSEMQEAHETRLVNDYRAQAESFVRGSDTHEFLRALGDDAATGLVMTEINNHYAANLDPSTGQGPVLSYQEAADRVEARIEEDMFGRYIKTQKMQKKFQELQGQTRAASRQPRTLTGNMTPQTSGRPQSEDDRMAAAYKQLTAAWQ